MTAKEIAERAYERMHGSDLAPIHVTRQLESEINQFALHIAEQAVEEERKLRQAPLYENTVAHSVINSILSRIKQLTEE